MKLKRARKSRKVRFTKVLQVILMIGITFPMVYFSGFGFYKLSIINHDFSTPISHAGGERIMEPLNRGLVALFGDNDSEVYLSWRLRQSAVSRCCPSRSCSVTFSPDSGASTMVRLLNFSSSPTSRINVAPEGRPRRTVVRSPDTSPYPQATNL